MIHLNLVLHHLAMKKDIDKIYKEVMKHIHFKQ